MIRNLAKFIPTDLELKGVHKHFLKHLNRILKKSFLKFMLKTARYTRLSTHNPRQRDRQAGPSGSPGPTGQPTGGRGWPCPAGFSPAVRSPAVWLLPTDSTRGGAPAGATCAARGPPERGDRRSWRAAALQGGGAGLFRRKGGRSGDFGSRPSFAIARRARCARK